jgi:hypothetical protein
MSDRDGLRRRAEVLQKVADQLSAQLRVERWSNKELRTLRGEPPAPGSLEDDRLAARRFLTFASVAVLTAAAVALFVSRPWRGADVVAGSAVMERPVGGSALGATIVPFTVVSAPEHASRLFPVHDARTSDCFRGSVDQGSIVDMDEIFSRPASRIELTPGAPRRHRAGLDIGVEDIFGSRPGGEVRRVP